MIKIVVAAHKPYRMPEDPMYLPLQVGAAGKASFGFQRDDEGENISDKNPSYCELTGLYWAWKNLDADYIGLAHYRRHFSLRKRGADKFDRVLTTAEAEALVAQSPVIVAQHRNYLIETNYSHYVHAHKAEGADALRRLIDSEYPEYSRSMHAFFEDRCAYMFNMCIMRRDLLDAYCAWLFEVLGRLEALLDISGWTVRETRVFGYLSEFLLNVWLHKNKVSVLEVPVLFMERENMLKKAFVALKLKFLGGGADG